MTVFLFSDIISMIILVTAGIFVISIVGLFLKPESVKTFWREYGIWAGFILALGSIVGSLIFSEVFRIPPCNLCWWQRIFLYPQLIVFGLAILKKITAQSAYRISLGLSIVGFAFSLYHYAVQFFLSSESIFCVTGAESCSSIDVISFGFVTIPFMAGVTFLVLILNGVLNRK